MKNLILALSVVALFSTCVSAVAAPAYPVMYHHYSQVEKYDVDVDYERYDVDVDFTSVDVSNRYNYKYTSTTQNGSGIAAGNSYNYASVYNTGNNNDNEININHTNVVDNSITNEYIRKKK